MRRLITVIIIIILVTLVIATGGWLLSRRAAVQNGRAPLTFRQFLTGETVGDPTTNPPNGSGSSVFVDPSLTDPNNTQSGTGSSTTGTGTSGPATGVSQFTNTGITPSTTNNPSGTSSTLPGSGIPGSQTTTGTGQSSNPIAQPPATIASTLASNGCSEEDKNITFTQDELSRLRGLQNRFYAVATTLHTDADVAAEIANYDNMLLKLTKLTALNQFCATHQPKIADPVMQRAVPTPFWHDSGRDILTGFFSNGANYGGDFTMGDAVGGQRNLDQALRLNLW